MNALTRICWIFALLVAAMPGVARSADTGGISCTDHGCTGAKTNPTPGPSKREITVVQVAPFSGPLGGGGKAVHAGAKLYFDSVNAQGGINGASIKFVTLDDGLKPEETVRLVKESLRASEVSAFIGMFGTANVDALLKDGALQTSGVPLVGPATGADLVVRGANIYSIRVPYRDEIDRLFRQLAGETITRVGVVYQDDALGKDVLAGVDAASSAQAIKVVGRATYARNTTKVEAAVAAMLKADPQAILIGTSTAAAIEFVKQYRAQGGLATLYGLSIIDTEAMLKQLGPELARGYAFSMVVPSPAQHTLGVVREYLRLRASATDSTDFGARSMEGFIAAKVLVNALRNGGTSPAGVQRGLRAMHHHDLGGFVLDYSGGGAGSHFVDFAMLGAGGKLVQ